MNKFKWWKVYFSPFKIIIPRLYIGKVRYGTPYFLPRKWVPFTYEDALNAAIKDSENKRHRNYGLAPESLAIEYLKYEKAVPKKIGFDFVSLGWKAKWSSTDYRHEWNPIWSFVFFKWQIALIFNPVHTPHYWECFLYYSKDTDKNKSKKERIKQAREEFPCIWENAEGEIHYWNKILKKKWVTI